MSIRMQCQEEHPLNQFIQSLFEIFNFRPLLRIKSPTAYTMDHVVYLVTLYLPMKIQALSAGIDEFLARI